MEWTPASGEQERHNATVITVGSRNYSLCSVSSSFSHATFEQPVRTLAIKWEVYILVKKSSCVFLLASLSLCRCELFYIYMCMYVDVNLHLWLYNMESPDPISLLVMLNLSNYLIKFRLYSINCFSGKQTPNPCHVKKAVSEGQPRKEFDNGFIFKVLGFNSWKLEIGKGLKYPSWHAYTCRYIPF